MATAVETDLKFTHLPHPSPTAPDKRAAVLANPGFGSAFSDHMVTIEWSEGRGWHDARVEPYGPITLDPATAVLHYAQEVFEGLKAYQRADDSIALFRPEANAARLNASARRLAMPELPEELFLESVRQLVLADRDWFPTVEGGSLYLRPFMFATEAFLGVRPAKQFKYMVIASPAGNYFKSGAPAVSIWVSDYSRAAPGGTGAAKCGGNLDAEEHKWIEELGGMNLYFVFDDGTLLTPPLTGTILPGITRDSLMTLAREEGLTVREERYAIDQWAADAGSGRLVECFACGTAAVVTPVGKVEGRETAFTIGSGGPGQLTMRLKERLVSIQRGTAPDTHGWVKKIA
jgi:branched-chain amino acid aminotransferase